MYCQNCRGEMQVYSEAKAGPNHVLHALLSVFLCGFWIPVWIFIALTDSKKRSVLKCTQCRRELA